ncbi:hypothetical protein J2S75_002597 [Ancylobacter polymorphus]|uniref:Uncharacterized protein n=1 Tax=Ancylobacter polymorphus TaxID=223390 RepID=A0ABU0BE22_9HYPH|nr:hypothetical protein [Ancylobacter polymorphus]
MVSSEDWATAHWTLAAALDALTEAKAAGASLSSSPQV